MLIQVAQVAHPVPVYTVVMTVRIARTTVHQVAVTLVQATVQVTRAQVQVTVVAVVGLNNKEKLNEH